LDPARRATHRQHFDETQRLLERLRVLEYSRQRILRRYETALLVVAVGIIVVSGSAHVVRQARQEGRLVRLQAALGELAAGRPDVRMERRRGERRHDVIGRIATMVERASRMMTRDRRRLASLENLSAWQESARRHAHEIRTPLAAARLELARLGDLVATLPPGAERSELARLQESLAQELDRLNAFTKRFTSFARLPQPALAVHDLGKVVGEFAELFATAWPELSVRFSPPGRPFEVLVDPEMLRQVLVNLGDNSAHALRDRGRSGTLTLSVAAVEGGVALDVADDGPGIPADLRGRLFEPYTTTRRIGEGMGLGLAIARKILLDHGGDLELLSASDAGTTFRVLLRGAPEVPSETPLVAEGRS
jgi:nitrogen fixation/metabolism regulation signal transduction histidine kinase